jgi:gas vesicle protein
VLVGALIGLILGIIAALLWEPASGLARRSAL